MFCFGVALSIQETAEFARHFNIPVQQGYLSHSQSVAVRLTELCGAKPPVMVEHCDTNESRGDIVMFTLATNYDVARGIDLSESFKKYRKIVEEAFGPSRKVGWWLEYTTNHDPGHYWVSNQRVVQSLVF